MPRRCSAVILMGKTEVGGQFFTAN